MDQRSLFAQEDLFHATENWPNDMLSVIWMMLWVISGASLGIRREIPPLVVASKAQSLLPEFSDPNPIHVQVACWKSPIAGHIKVKVDASLSKDGKAGLGKVIRDCKGCLLGDKQVLNEGWFNVEVLQGIRLESNAGFLDIKSVINYLKSRNLWFGSSQSPDL